MSDHWEYYPCLMDDVPGTVVYDHGISETIDDLAIDHSVRFQLPFKSPSDEGMPDEEESEQAGQIEAEIKAHLDDCGGIYVGRLTLGGRRVFYTYHNAEEQLLESLTERLSAEFGHRITFETHNDPEKTDYWRDLFPSKETWRWMQNLKIVHLLEQQGDPLEQSRRIDHWASFPDGSSLDEFSRWLQSEDFDFEFEARPEEASDSEKHELHFYHDNVPTLSYVGRVIISLQSRVEELGGSYDGWESCVVKETDD